MCVSHTHPVSSIIKSVFILGSFFYLECSYTCTSMRRKVFMEFIMNLYKNVFSGADTIRTSCFCKKQKHDSCIPL